MKTELTITTKGNLLQGIPDGSFLVVDGYFKTELEKTLSKHHVYWLNNPEQSKNLTTYAEICSFLFSSGIDRSSTLWAIGGGATSDLTGFTAATILRGINWKIVPTTLLSQIDAALGGKVAVNLPLGKNLVGAFHHPEQIYICDEWLKTLPPHELKSGMGELIKYGMLDDEIYTHLFKHIKIDQDLILKCLEFKNKIVTQDPLEKNLRKCLNLGHTFGHALEVLGNLTHGESVVMGMEILFNSFNSKSDLAKLQKLKDLLNFTTNNIPQIESDKFWEMVDKDKKKDKGELTLIFPNKENVYSEKKITLKDCRKIVGEAYETLA